MITLPLTVADDDGGSATAEHRYIVVYDPAGGFVTCGGWIDSPQGGYAPDPSLTGKATFGFVSKYKKGADVPEGNTQFVFQVADLNFHSTEYQWLVVAGNKAKFKGYGTINGQGSYGFMITATDGDADGGVDTFRIKIWNPIAHGETRPSAWQSDEYAPYIHGEDPYPDGTAGVLCLGDNIGHLQIDTGESPRAIQVYFPTHQGLDGWLYGPPTYLTSGLYDFDQLQLSVHDVPSTGPGRSHKHRGGLENMVLDVKYHCQFGLYLHDPVSGLKIAWNSHYRSDPWHWDDPEPDLYMIRVAEDEWHLVNTGYINHFFTPDDPTKDPDHPVFMPFKILITKLPEPNS